MPFLFACNKVRVVFCIEAYLSVTVKPSIIKIKQCSQRKTYKKFKYAAFLATKIFNVFYLVLIFGVSYMCPQID